MPDLADLQRTVRILKDTEDIKKLKAKYLRCIDKKLWDELAECFAEDAVAHYAIHGCYKGVKAITGFFSGISRASRKSVIGRHQSHNPEIDVTGDTTAKGTWQLRYFGVDMETNKELREYAFHYDEYVKENGEWRIKYTQLAEVFREEFERDTSRIQQQY